MSALEVQEEVMDVLEKVWTKLQALPQASPLEMGAFAVILLFVGTFLLMMVVAMLHCCCCCCGKPKHQATRVEPQPV